MAFLLFSSFQKPGKSQSNFGSIQTNKGEKGLNLEIKFLKGKSFNHPTFSFWVEDLEGNYIETLMVTQYVAKGVYGHGSLGNEKWNSKPGPAAMCWLQAPAPPAPPHAVACANRQR